MTPLTFDSENTLTWHWDVGADTTVSAVASFFLLMALYPDVQAKAQEEIDRVVGKDRLPIGSDRANLKYVDCVMREVMRLYPVAPLGEWAVKTLFYPYLVSSYSTSFESGRQFPWLHPPQGLHRVCQFLEDPA